jgi:hypothetical protein
MKRFITILASVLVLSSCMTLDEIPSVQKNIESGEDLSANKRYLAGYLDIDTGQFSFDESLSETKYDGNAELYFREKSGSKECLAYLPYQGPFVMEIPNRDWLFEHLLVVESKYAMGIDDAKDFKLLDPFLISSEKIPAGTVTYIGTLRLVSAENGLGGKTYMISATDESDDFRPWFEENYASRPEELSFIRRPFPAVLEVQKKKIDLIDK